MIIFCCSRCLTLDGASRFFAGAQTFWGQHASVTARSPRRFRDDFRQMRAFGMRWTRCFLPCRTEAELRDSDAIVQLAQKYGLVLYHTPNLANTPSRAELDEEIARMKQICTRYRDVPGFVVDICNEPSLKMATPGGESKDIHKSGFFEYFCDSGITVKSGGSRLLAFISLVGTSELPLWSKLVLWTPPPVWDLIFTFPQPS